MPGCHNRLPQDRETKRVSVNRPPDRVDVLVGGAGFAGLALAIALRRTLGETFSVMVTDPTLDPPLGPSLGRSVGRESLDARASAISAAARRLFETLGVWPAVADEAQPILDMVISDSKLDDTMRPVFLTFAGDVADGEPFAHMVENRLLLAALADRAKAEDVRLLPCAVEQFVPGAEHVAARLSDGHTVTAKLVVAADGARSQLRDQAGIRTYGWPYGQSAIVTTVAHERPHHGRAEEHFLPAGPFAILPLKPAACGRPDDAPGSAVTDRTTIHRASLVWVETAAEAERILALDEAAFLAELEKRFGLHLGPLRVIGRKAAFPLGYSIAASFVAERLALVGDAAHMIHPVAGQGLNLALRDIAALAESITDAARLGLDCGGPPVLERYQRWRRFDTAMMGIATDGINRLFSNQSDVLRLARDIGLGMVERMPTLKNALIREAAGFTGEVPKLLRGEAL